ncbi:MAG: hypothetical protein V1752_00335 [Candidatus Firestonebacteria bacterium]
MKKYSKIIKVFVKTMMLPALILFGLITGCAQNKDIIKDQNTLQKTLKSIEKTEKKIEELKKLPENEKIIQKVTKDLNSAKKALDKGDLNKSLEISKKTEEIVDEKIKEQEIKSNAIKQLTEAKELYESAVKSGAGGKCKDMTNMSKADLRKAESHFKAGEYIDSVRFSLSSMVSSNAALEMCKGVTDILYTVAKGDCLWNISKKKEIYNDPFMWPLIYKNNMNIIKNPDLIYPKQEFKLQLNPDEEKKKRAKKEAWFGFEVQ